MDITCVRPGGSVYRPYRHGTDCRVMTRPKKHHAGTDVFYQSPEEVRVKRDTSLRAKGKGTGLQTQIPPKSIAINGSASDDQEIKE